MRRWLKWGVGAILGLLAGCSTQPVVVPPPAPAPEPVKIEAPRTIAAPPKATVAPPVIILISSNIPAYTDIAEQLQRRLGTRAKRILLDEHATSSRDLGVQLSGAPVEQIVAIGLEAALRAKTLQQTGHPVVFCQVFNYLEHDLASERMKGVNFLPSYEETFAAWRALAPATKRVGVFTGPGLEAMLAPAVRTAARHDISLVHITVNSDKDFLYTYKRMASELDGLWLLPDNRILSRTAIQDVMSYSVRNSRQVAVFTEQLLKLGGLFSVASEAEDIAMKVLQRLAAAQSDGVMEGPAVLELQRTELHINPVIAQRFNLTIPPHLRRHVLD